MARPELGEKRICGNCGAKFYDLGRDPIVCPKCATVYELHATEKVAPVTEAPKAKPVEETEEEETVVATTGPEIVSLEEADEDEGETVDGDDIPDDVEVDVEDDDDASDDTFLETDDDEDEDVAGIVPVGKDDEDT